MSKRDDNAQVCVDVSARGEQSAVQKKSLDYGSADALLYEAATKPIGFDQTLDELEAGMHAEAVANNNRRGGCPVIVDE